MRILYFHQYFSTREGATGTRSYEMARALLARGHEVVVVCGSYEGSTTGLQGPFRRGVRRGSVDGIEVIELEIRYSNRLSFVSRAYTFVKFALAGVRVALTEPCDAVFATSTPLTAGLPGLASRWLRRKPFVFEVRDLWPEFPRQMGVIRSPVVLATLSALEWACYRSARAVIGLAPGIVKEVVRRGVSEARVHLIPNGCDMELFADTPATARPQGVAEGDLMAVFAGAHGIANGLDAVLDAAAVLAERGRSDIKFVFVGDGKLKKDLVERAARDRLENCVFLAPMSKLDLAGLLRAADVGLQVLADVPAFYYGTSPNKFFDYLAAGLPVVVNYPGWMAEMVVGNDCGAAVPSGDARAFAAALEALAADPEARRRMGNHSRMLGARDFDRKVHAERFVNVLEGIAERPSTLLAAGPPSKTVWYICKYAAPGKYGLATRHFQLAREWVEQGHRCCVFSSNSSHLITSLPRFSGASFEETVDGVQAIWLNVMGYPSSGGWQRVASWIQFEWRLFRLDRDALPRPDVIIVSSLSLLTILTGARLARVYRARLIFEVRDIWPLTAIEIGGYSARHPLMVALARIERFGYRRADAIVGTMPNLVEHVRSVCPEAAHKVHCVPQGTRPNEAVEESLPASYLEAFRTRAFRVGYAGALNLANPLDTLVKAAKLLEGESVEFHLLGRGSQLETLKEMAKDTRNVHFHEPVPRAQVAHFLSFMDVCYDSFDSAVGRFGLSRNKWIDYMSAGKPIICSFDGYQSMINEADAGLFVPFGAPDALASAILRLRDLGSDELQRMGARGRHFLHERRSFTTLAADYARLF